MQYWINYLVYHQIMNILITICLTWWFF